MITPITDHEEQALARLVSQFKGKVRIEGIIQTLCNGQQQIEDEFYKLLTLRWVSSATGAQLDIIGAIVGQPRQGSGDTAYRIAIRGKIGINTSDGTPEDAITVFQLLFGATDVMLQEHFPGVVEIFANVNIEYVLEGDGPEAFAFDGGIDGLGFGDVFDSTVGGTFANLYLYDVAIFYALMDKVLSAGIRIGALGYWEGGEAFTFEGGPTGAGFGDVFDASVGGGFATIAPP